MQTPVASLKCHFGVKIRHLVGVPAPRCYVGALLVSTFYKGYSMSPLSRVRSQEFGTKTRRAPLDMPADVGTSSVHRKLETRWDRHDRGDRGVTTALLLAAGRGTRLRPLTDDSPKCLTEVCGIPILGRLLTCWVREGFKRLVVVVGHHGDKIRAYLDLHGHGIGD
jgi:hypothetical protein